MKRLTPVLTFIGGIAAAFAIPAAAQRIVMIFPDVPSGMYFSDAVTEFSARGVLKGYDTGRFAPDDPVTRGQVALMFQRYDAEVINPLREQINALRDEAGMGQCGDTDIQDGEECDDGNRESGDGCAVDCTIEEGMCSDGRMYGERFRSPDGCNTCTCTEAGIACTKMACATSSRARSSARSVRSSARSRSSAPSEGGRCFGSGECPPGLRCSTERGDCQPACPPGSDACIQVCAGVCEQPDTSGIPGCGDGVCAEGEAGSCFSDCGGFGGNACRPERGDLDAVIARNVSCNADSDCEIFMASCPFLTCGVAVNRNGIADVRAAAESVISCQESQGQPVACAGCLQMQAACEAGRCVARRAMVQ